MSILENLNPAQREAVVTIEGPLLVLAGPGSGKTRVISHRIAYMIEQGIADTSILAITFTNKAAGEMAERVQLLVGANHCWISTFHSFAARMLRIYGEELGFTKNFTIYDTADSLSVVREVLEELELPKEEWKAQSVLHKISLWKQFRKRPEEVKSQVATYRETLLLGIYQRYQEKLYQKNAMDFDDLLLYFLDLLENPKVSPHLKGRFRYLLVDEYQDTNYVQYLIVRSLAEEHRNVCCTGDPDQSIYGWRGATIQNILHFERDFPECKVVKLETNYRSTKAILEAASRLIQHNQLRKEKKLYTENPVGPPVRIHQVRNEWEEAEKCVEYIFHWQSQGVPLSEIAVFYRLNSLSRHLEEALRRNGIPYTLVGSVAFYQRKEVKDPLAYLRLLVNPWDSIAFCRIVNVPPRRIGKKTVQALLAFQEKCQKDFLELALYPEEIPTLGKGAKKSLANFGKLMKSLKDLPRRPVAPLLETLLSQIDYSSYLEKNYSGEELLNRLSNLTELVKSAYEFDEQVGGSLEEFLERIALISDVDEWDAEDRVSLMTLHASKGLEFQAVIVVGVEEGILPHGRSVETKEALEEERRLLYVGITRAKRFLVLLHAKSRRNYRGGIDFSRPSPFLAEIQGAPYFSQSLESF